ncbi:hypothetical protein [Micromonospora sp. LOL_024]|uniref:hypothetical protein n=1 Tax=Micromonospora sp. LOL_024 TaxID=3345412 RepID=UPI003A8C22DA
MYRYMLTFTHTTNVAQVAALVAYRHLSGLLDHDNEEPLIVCPGPLATLAEAPSPTALTGRLRDATTRRRGLSSRSPPPRSRSRRHVAAASTVPDFGDQSRGSVIALDQRRERSVDQC